MVLMSVYFHSADNTLPGYTRESLTVIPALILYDPMPNLSSIRFFPGHGIDAQMRSLSQNPI
jgi:hypothetical protein